jgi:O-antigen/teichoic acid export membrane protein
VAFLPSWSVNALTYAGLAPAVVALGADRHRDRTAVGLSLLGGTCGAVIMWGECRRGGHALKAPDAAPLIRLVGLSLPLTQFGEVASALMERDLHFRGPALAQIIASVASCTAGIGYASRVVGQQLWSCRPWCSRSSGD